MEHRHSPRKRMGHHGMHRTMTMRRGRRGRGFGPPLEGPGRGKAMAGFLAEHPDCADKMVRYHVAAMLDDGFDPEEVREHLAYMQDRGFLPDLDIDAILDN